MSVGLLVAIAGLACTTFLCGWMLGRRRDSRIGARSPSQPAQPAQPLTPADGLVSDLERVRRIRPDAGRGSGTTSATPGGASRLFVPPWGRRGLEVRAASARARRASQSREGSDRY